jgi:hypothetical protein
MPAEKQFPQVNYENRLYFNEEVNAFKIWHTSAWKESPWQDINKLNEIYKGLHNFTAQLICIGANLDRRFKIYAIPQSPMVSEQTYAAAKAECEAIPLILARQMNTPVTINPQQAQQATPQGVVVPFQLPGASQNVPAFTLGSASQTPVTEETVDDLPFEASGEAVETERKPLKSMF